MGRELAPYFHGEGGAVMEAEGRAVTRELAGPWGQGGPGRRVMAAGGPPSGVRGHVGSRLPQTRRPHALRGPGLRVWGFGDGGAGVWLAGQGSWGWHQHQEPRREGGHRVTPEARLPGKVRGRRGTQPRLSPEDVPLTLTLTLGTHSIGVPAVSGFRRIGVEAGGGLEVRQTPLGRWASVEGRPGSGLFKK